MTSAEFRAALVKIMPGYAWTVHKTKSTDVLLATGTRSSGMNRTSTVEVNVTKDLEGNAVYFVRSSGFGRRAPWLHEHKDTSLARAFRGLQDYYERTANTYRSHAASLQHGRTAEGGAASPASPAEAER